MRRAPTTFEEHRPTLFGLAYRMLGSVADAEDVLQDAFLRWDRIDPESVAHPRAFLSKTVSRLCLDKLKEAHRRREVYVGPWLPEPILNDPATAVAAPESVAGDVSFALMLALERLSPLERAAFLLHDVFDTAYDEIAAILGRTEAACRQLVRRARTHVRAERPRFDVAPDRAAQIASAFFSAAQSGDADALRTLLAEDAVLHSDGGGQARAALNLIQGHNTIARFYAGLAAKASRTGDAAARVVQRTTINGLPGELAVGWDGLLQTTAIEISGDRIAAIYVTRNPDKLSHLTDFAEDAALPIT